MSFADTLTRLDAIVMNWQPGEQAETCRVRRQDLRELLHHFRRLDAEARQNPPHEPNLRVTAEEYNRAFDAANEALGGAFMAGFREGWIYAEIDADGERYQEMAEEYALAVDSAPQEAWDAHRAEFFNMLPIAALPEVPDNG